MPAADLAAGRIAPGDLVNAAKLDPKDSIADALAVTGIYDFPKATGGGTALAAGVTVYWNSGTGVATATASGNKLLGKTVKAAADADALVRVRLFQ